MSSPSFKQIKARVASLRSQRERAEGALEQLEGRLKADFDTDIARAPQKLSELKQGATDAKLAYDESLADFMGAWGDLLELGGDDEL